MSEFSKWSRGDLADEGRRTSTPRRPREPWQQKHDAIFRAVWGETSSRTFPAKPREQLPVIQPPKRKPGRRLGLVLGLVFIAGVVFGWLAK